MNVLDCVSRLHGAKHFSCVLPPRLQGSIGLGSGQLFLINFPATPLNNKEKVMRIGIIKIEIYDDPQYAVVDQSGKRIYAADKFELLELLDMIVPDLEVKEETNGFDVIILKEDDDNTQE